MRRELQYPAIFRDGTHDLIGGPVPEHSLDLERDRHLRSDQASQMGDDFLGDTSGISAHARRVQLHTPVKATHRWRGRHGGLLDGSSTSAGGGVAEGRRELATLSAVGADPAVRRRLAGAQALVISGVGALVGVVLGSFVSYALRATFGAPSFTVPWEIGRAHV